MEGERGEGGRREEQRWEGGEVVKEAERGRKDREGKVEKIPMLSQFLIGNAFAKQQQQQ